MMGPSPRFPNPIARWAREVLLPGLLVCTTSAFATAPYVHTQPAILIRSSSATLGGMVVPNGLPTTAWFQWGATTNYGSLTAATNVGDGDAVVRLTSPLAGLAVNGAFHFRCVASNATSVAYGADQQWTTGRKLTLWGYNDSGQANLPPGENIAVAVAGGWWHSLAQKPNGTLAVWGSGIYASLTIPDGLTEVASIAAGHSHDLALLPNGTVAAWGYNGSGQTNVPPGLSNVISVGGGYAFSAALKADGTIAFWGDNSYGQTNPPAGLSNVVAIAVGGHHVVALKAGGTVVAWGLSNYGQTNVPPTLSNVVAIAAGYFHSLALQRDGTLVPWGYNSWPLTNPPVAFSNIVVIAAGGFNSAALRTDGSLVVVGSNEHGQTQVPPLLNPAVGMALGEYHVIALANHSPWVQSQTLVAPTNHDVIIKLTGSDTNGETLIFAINTLPTSGDLYQFTTNGRGDPITVLSPWVSDVQGRVIFAPVINQTGVPSSSFTFVAHDGDVNSAPGTVTINFLGTLYAATQPAWVSSASTAKLNGMVSPNGFTTLVWFEWGDNPNFGQTTPPTSAGDGGGVVRVTHALGGLHTQVTYHCRLVASNATGVVYGAHQVFTTGNKVAAWGDDTYGQVSGVLPRDDVTSVAAGWSFSLALQADGVVRAWGKGNVGQTNIPAAATNVVAITADYEHGLALKSDGTVVAWGYNSSPPYYSVTDLSNVVAVASGGSHTLALQSNGVVVARGSYGYNPVIVPAGLSNVVAIAAAWDRSLALCADGTVAVWGANTSPLAPPPGLTNVVAIATGSAHSLALRSDGTCVAWGDNDSGQTNVPVGLSNVVAIASRQRHNLALKRDGTVVAWGSWSTGETNVPPNLAMVSAIAAGSGHSLAVGPNVAPNALAQTATGAINQDLVITLKGTDVNGDPLSFRITSLPALGSLFQYTGGGRGAPIVQGAVVSDNAGRVIFAPATNAFGRPYTSFTFLATDDALDSTVATVTIIITSPTWAATRAVTHSTATGATLNGVAKAGHLPTTVWFEWGNSRAYGQMTAPQQLAAGNELAWLSATITGLTAQSVYHCRLVASNAGGIALGVDRVFTTGRRAVVWDDPYVWSPPAPQGPSNAVAICGGYSHMVALRNDGLLTAWGSNADGQTTIPTNLTDVVQVAAGAYHNLALKPDGTVVAWGRNDNQQTNAPFGLSGVKQVACGNYHSLALKSNGNVVAWGDNRYGQNQVPVWLTDAVAIADSMSICAALRSNGAVVAWGGGGNYASTNVPAGLTNVVDVDAGVAVRADGTVVVWGDGLTAPTNWFDIVEVDGALAIKADSTIAGWGSGTVDPIAARFTNVAFIAGTHILAAIGNLPPVALPQILKCAANHDFTIELKATDPQDDPISFRISALPAKGSLYQFSGGGRGPQIATPDTPVTDVQNRVVFTPAPDEYNSPYTTFGYIARDVELDSTEAVVTVSIIGMPYAVTQPAAPVGPTNAVLNGMVVPNGFPTRAWFEWGTNLTYGQTTVPVDIGAGAQVVRVSTILNGLASNTVIHFRLVASNAASVTYGARQLLTTGRRLTAWGGNGYGQTNVSWSLKGVSGVATDFGTSYALRTDGTTVAWGYGATNSLSLLSNVVSIGNGIALKSDGSVVVWGSNSYGETNVPTGLNNVMAISSSGGLHRLALRADGTVAAWGYNNSGQTNVPPGLSNVVAISSGNWFSAALKADGTVVAWGSNTSGETNVPANLSNVVAIASSGFHSLALQADGRVVNWGNSTGGSAYDTPPSNATNVVAIACGDAHNHALRADGTLVSWGQNVSGVLNKPSWLSNVVAVAAGTVHAVVLRENRPPNANSQNRFGTANQDQIVSLGGADPDGDSLSFRITSLPALGSLYQYSGGGRGALITSNNTIVTGSTLIFAPATNTFGAPYASFNFLAGDGEADSPPATVTFSIVGTPHTASLPAAPITKSHATLRSMVYSSGLPTTAWFEWGTTSSYGQSTTPVVVPGGSSLGPFNISITNLLPGAQYHFRIVVTNASGSAAGADQGFQTGARMTSWGYSGIYNLTNIAPGVSNTVAIAAGFMHNLALGVDGRVRAWGGGDVFYGRVDATNVPAGLSNVIAISAGEYFSVALRSNGTVAAWGGYPTPNPAPSSEIIVPPGLSNVVAIASSGHHTLALRGNGSVTAWGYNSYGQTNVPAGLSNVVAVAAGSAHSLALRMDGTVATWGYNASGQVSVPANVQGIVGIAAGSGHSVALRSNGTVVAWGGGPEQINVPPGLSNVVKIAAGDVYSVALKSDGNLVAWGKNDDNQTNVPSGLSNVIDIACAVGHSLALGGNLPPVTLSGVVTGYVNTELTLTLPGYDRNGDLLTLRVTSAPAQGALYQFNAGTRGAQIIPPATVLDLSNRVIFVPGPNEFGSPYSSFDVIANDGEADSTLATMTVHVKIPQAPQMSAGKSGLIKVPAPTLNAAAAGLSSNGGFGLRFMGYSNLTYQVWASTNLVQWSLLGTTVPTTNGWWQFVDSDATNWPRRFYRIGVPDTRVYNLNFTGQSNATYRVWASTNLTTWELLGTANITSNGWFQFVDFDSARWPQRFYRAGAP